MDVLFGRGAAHLLIWAVMVMLYRAGADEDICAVNTEGKQGQRGCKDIFRSLTGDRNINLVCYHQ